MDSKKIIGNRINAALALSNCKQKELAAHLEIPDNTISYFCSGKRVPNAEQIIKISQYLHVSADYLLGLSENKSDEEKLNISCEYTGLSEEAVNELVKWKNGRYELTSTPQSNVIIKPTDFLNELLTTDYVTKEYGIKAFTWLYSETCRAIYNLALIDSKEQDDKEIDKHSEIFNLTTTIRDFLLKFLENLRHKMEEASDNGNNNPTNK